MKADRYQIGFGILLVVLAFWQQPWQKREYPEGAELLAFVKRVGDAVERYRKDGGGLPRRDSPSSIIYYLLREGPNPPYLELTEQEKKDLLKIPEDQKLTEARTIEILDPLGNPLVYRRPTTPRFYDLYSVGADGYDDGGMEDDVNYLPPHFDEAFWRWRQGQLTVLKWMAFVAALMIARFIYCRVRRSNEEPEQDEDATPTRQ